jgi:hypothetical protein
LGDQAARDTVLPPAPNLPPFKGNAAGSSHNWMVTSETCIYLLHFKSPVEGVTVEPEQPTITTDPPNSLIVVKTSLPYAVSTSILENTVQMPYPFKVMELRRQCGRREDQA